MNRNIAIKHYFCLFLLGANIAFAEFEGPPSSSSGIIQKEIEDDYKERPVDPDRQVPDLKVDIPEEQLSMDEGISVFIREIRIQGNDILSRKEIDKVLAPYQNKELTMGQIQEVCLKLQNRYLQEGYFLARAYPPPQEIRDGILTLEVMEGKLGNILVQGNKYYKTHFVEKYFAKFQKKAIQYNALYKSLLLLNENPDMQARIIFKKGENVGTADLVVQVEDTRPLHLAITESNFGSAQSSLWRTNLQASYGNLLTQGDTLTFRESLGNPIRNVNFSQGIYTAPLNTVGTKLQGSFGYSKSKTPDLEKIVYSGQTRIASAKIEQALVRTRQTSMDLYCTFEYKQILNRAQHQTQSYDKLRVATLGWTLDNTDRLRGRNLLDLSFSYGIPHFLGGLHTQDPLCSRKNSGGLFNILAAEFTRVQALPKNCTLLLRMQGQATPYRLPIVQQMYIGGPTSVRGFPTGCFVGDNAYTASVEFRVPPPFLSQKKIPFSTKTWREFMQILAFVDQGGIALNGNEEKQKRHANLTGTGVGARFYFPYGMNVSFDVGFPLTKKVYVAPKKKQKSPLFYFQVTLQPF
jgi:hemolysin activation/secretion protein